MAEGQTVWRVLAAGELESTLRPIYVVNPNLAAQVHQMRFVSKSSTNRIINVYLSAKIKGEFGTPRLIVPNNLILLPGGMCIAIENPLQLSDGDQFWAVSDIPGSVDYTVFGVEAKQANEVLQS